MRIYLINQDEAVEARDVTTGARKRWDVVLYTDPDRTENCTRGIRVGTRIRIRAGIYLC